MDKKIILIITIILCYLFFNFNKDDEIDDYGFIILRHVNSEKTNEYWKLSYDSVRKYYPEYKIIIIDDNSDYNFITEKELYKTTIIKSEYPGRGELLPYYYYLKNKNFKKAIIIHDSVFINKYINFEIDDYKMIWNFDHGSDDVESEKNILKIFNDKKIVEFYDNKDMWKGCFGGMSIISHDYLSKINKDYKIKKLLDVILNRNNRMSFERVIACLLQINNNIDNTLLGNIHEYCEWGITFSEKDKSKHLPIIKVWSGR